MLDYFEREVKILQQLDHPKIPKYIDYFVSDSNNNSYYQITSRESCIWFVGIMIMAKIVRSFDQQNLQ